ncbi:hypothetical protein H1R81_19810 [Emticicia sp. BO119]|nr:hypothetical protein [Emticicia sp. BO119]
MKKISKKMFNSIYKELIRIRGVNYVAIGYKEINGIPDTQQIAIRVHVTKKRAESEIFPDEIIPKSVNGIPTDVIESLWVNEANHLQQRFSDLRGGIQIINPIVKLAGTLGGIFTDLITGNLIGLTAAHNLKSGQIGNTGDEVYQPSLDPLNVNDFIGTIHSINTPLDAGTILLNTKRNLFQKEIVNGNTPITIQGVIPPSLGMQVFKVGCATGFTEGTIDDISPTTSETFTIKSINNTILSDFGDSGAIWIDRDSECAVGLHIQGNPITHKNALASSIHRIFSVLKLDTNLLHLQ